MSKVIINTKKSCWKNYKQVGTKEKNGKTVPNCVPEEYRNISRKAGYMTKQAAIAASTAGAAKRGAKDTATGGLRNEIRTKLGLKPKPRKYPEVERLNNLATKHATRAANIANVQHNHKPGVAQAKSRANKLRGIIKTVQSLEKMHQNDVNTDRKSLEKNYAKSVNEAYRMQAQTGNILSILVTWRGKYLDMQMFFPKLGFPTRKEVEHEIQKIYPDSRLIRYKRKDYDPNSPIIKVTEESKSEMPCNKPRKNGKSKLKSSYIK